MQFFHFTIVAVLASGFVLAAPAPDEPFPISRLISVGGYNLTTYHDAPSTPSERALGPRACGTADVTCSSSHAASPAICSQLITTINSNSGNILGDSPRAVCLGQSSNQCCISWSKAVGPMLQGSLSPAATKVYNVCLSGSTLLQSGEAKNVILNGGCVIQCLSNRPGGCGN
ncbi:hypothetical protein C8J57DRAFT_1237625 [Mycena rebaudengoi]|nr:hypothetical protein C8J57DRAFT_1237625 [Mycena rebaudengoi]